jgi:hypothetical protein
MAASKTLRVPYNFDFSKNREYTALRIAGGKRKKKRKKRIENTLLRDDSAPPNEVTRRRRITASTTRSKLIAPSSASRNRSAAIYRQPRAGDGERSPRFLLALAFFLAFPRTKRIAENAKNATKATHNSSRTTSKMRSP